MWSVELLSTEIDMDSLATRLLLHIYRLVVLCTSMICISNFSGESLRAEEKEGKRSPERQASFSGCIRIEPASSDPEAQLERLSRVVAIAEDSINSVPPKDDSPTSEMSLVMQDRLLSPSNVVLHHETRLAVTNRDSKDYNLIINTRPDINSILRAGETILIPPTKRRRTSSFPPVVVEGIVDPSPRANLFFCTHPRHGQSNESGDLVVEGLAPGVARIRLWHESFKQDVSRVTVNGEETVCDQGTIQVRLSPGENDFGDVVIGREVLGENARFSSYNFPRKKPMHIGTVRKAPGSARIDGAEIALWNILEHANDRKVALVAYPDNPAKWSTMIAERQRMGTELAFRDRSDALVLLVSSKELVKGQAVGRALRALMAFDQLRLEASIWTDSVVRVRFRQLETKRDELDLGQVCIRYVNDWGHYYVRRVVGTKQLVRQFAKLAD